MTLAQMESRFFELKGKLAVGQITEDEFKRGMETLRFQDQQGRWWMIGAQSGRWYYYDGTRWQPGQPPAPTGTASTPDDKAEGTAGQTAQSKTVEPTTIHEPPKSQPPLATPSVRYTPPPQTPVASPPHIGDDRAARSNIEPVVPPRRSQAPVRQPTLTERVRGEMTHVHVPPMHVPPMHVPQVHTPKPIRRYSPNAILVGAAAIGLVMVALLWLAVDNIVPGKPISSFFGRTLGIGAASVVATPAVRATPFGADVNVENIVRVGDGFISNSQFDTGLTQYQSAARLDPTNAEVYIHWSRALALAGRIQEAINAAQRATRLDPKSAEAFAQLARALAWSGQNDAAVSAGEQAISLDAKNVAAHAFLAEAYLRGGQQSEAEKEAAAALGLDNTNADAHRTMGWVALIGGHKDQALSEWQQVVLLAPGIFFYHFEFGQVYTSYLNDPASAIPEYQKAIQLYPPYVPSYLALGRVYLAQNQPGPAILQYQKVLTFDPNSNDAYVGLATAFKQQDRCQQAIPYFQKSLQLNPNGSDALRGLADCGALAQGQPTPGPAAPTAVGLEAVPTAIVQATVVPLAGVTPSPKAPAPVSTSAPSGAKRAGRIAFSVYDGQYHLYVANADGSNRKLLTELASDPAFSPDGSQLLYASWESNTRGIHRIEANGTADQQISLRVEDLLPSWAPDGTRYVYATRAGIGADLTKRAYSLRIDDPTAKANQDPPPFVERAQYPVWGPADKIVFRDCGFPTDSCGLALINSDGSGKTSLVANMNGTAPAWSPDGKLIAFTSDYGGNWDIYIVSANGGSPARLTVDPAEDGVPTFSPDGKQIAFLSHRGGTWAVWAMGIDGSNQTKLFDLGGDPAGMVPGNSPAQPGQVWYEQKISWR